LAFPTSLTAACRISLVPPPFPKAFLQSSLTKSDVLFLAASSPQVPPYLCFPLTGPRYAVEGLFPSRSLPLLDFLFSFFFLDKDGGPASIKQSSKKLNGSVVCDHIVNSVLSFRVSWRCSRLTALGVSPYSFSF